MRLHILMTEGYGITEGAPVVLTNPIAGKGVRKVGSCAVPLVPEIEVAAFDENDRPVKEGEAG